MATKSLIRVIKSKTRLLAVMILLMIAIISVFIIYNFSTFRGNAQLSASYASHIICSCRYIQGRSLEDCKKDFEPGMELVTLSDDPENKRMTAYVPLLAEAVAQRRGKFGCIQLNEEEIDAL